MTRRCRLDFMDLATDAAALDLLADGLNYLWSQGVIQAAAQQHSVNFENGIHWSPQFLSWHRWFLLDIEDQLRAFDSRITLPYWDWTRADSRDLDVEPWKSFFGGRDNTGGRFDHWSYTRAPSPGGTLATMSDVLDALAAPTYQAFRQLECSAIHGGAHNWTGFPGHTMAGGDSPLDPLFFLHHGNIDRLWAIWQRHHAAAAQYEVGANGCDRSPTVAQGDPMIGGATPGSMLDHEALGYRFPRDPALEAAAAGVPGLAGLQTGDPVSIALETSEVRWTNVAEGETTARAALFRITGCDSLTFEVTAGPAAPFALYAPGPYPFPVAGSQPTDEFRLWFLYTAGAAGTSANASVTVVARDGTGAVVDTWAIPLAANAVQRPTAAVALVLDESGSMLKDAGNGRIRIDVLRDAAATLIDDLYDDNGVALVAFSDAAQRLRDLAVAGPLTSTTRSDARGDIAVHGPASAAPLTSIAAGLQEAAATYAASPLTPGFDVTATVVFTDGFETRAPWLDDVGPLLTERVYAVGIADADNVSNDTLADLASGSKGFMLVSGALTQDDEFLLEKFFLQVLVGLTNQQMVRDPSGRTLPGVVERVPFHLTEADTTFDAVVLCDAPGLIRVALEAPDGTVILPEDLPPGSVRIGHRLHGLRLTLPVVADGTGHHAGRWHLLFTPGVSDRVASKGRLALTAVADRATAVRGRGGMRYEALVHARSGLQMDVSVDADGTRPGSKAWLRARITEYGRPLPRAAAVRVEVTDPAGTVTTVPLGGDGHGTYSAPVQLVGSGAHRFRFLARGMSVRGSVFEREHLASAVIGADRPRPADGGGRPPGGPAGSDDAEAKRLCRLLRRLSESGELERCLGGGAGKPLPRDHDGCCCAGVTGPRGCC